METADAFVLKTLRDWRLQGQQAILVTLVRTWGSAPRPVGSIMALSETGAVVGSVSGGCIEDDLIARYTGSRGNQNALDLWDRPTEKLRYGITPEKIHRFGLPCGGTLELLLEFNPDAGQLAQLVNRIESGVLTQRLVWLGDGRVQLSPLSLNRDLKIDEQIMSRTFGPHYRMLLIGAGAIAQYLSSMAQSCGFLVTVCEPRQEYIDTWSTPSVSLMRDWPDDAVLRFKPDSRTCVIALSHDPKFDDSALLEALKTPAFYIGAIGSRENNRSRHERLSEHFGVNDEVLSRLRGPIGIFIGSKTPAEIAVSVMAEILAVKNGVALPTDLDVAYAKNFLMA
jgi:xanthine dehydrogenase accessory factor